MGSKGRMPPPHLRHPLPGPGMVRSDAFGPGMRPPPGAFPPFDMLPPPEVMEQKLHAQHGEMQKLATENQRLAATHGTLRQELAAAQNELQMLHAQIGAVKSEREQQMRGLLDKISKMQAELQASEPVKSELQQARADAQSLVVVRQELISKAQKLNQDLQRAHMDVQQIPALMSELESLRQEYQNCRVTYDSERKLYGDHLESLKVMEKNYMTMAGEVEKLRAKLTNTVNIVEKRTGGSYGSTGYNENEVSGHYPVGQNTYDGYGVPQGRASVPGSETTVAKAGDAPALAGAQSGPTPPRASYDSLKGPTYDPPKGASYDAQRGANYETQQGPGYDPQRGLSYDGRSGPNYDGQRGYSYDAQRAAGYDAMRAAAAYDPQGGFGGYDLQRGPSYDTQMQRGSGYDTARSGGYDNAARGGVNPQGQVAPPNNVPYGYDVRSVGYDAPRGAVNLQGQVGAPPNNAPYGSTTPPNRVVSGGFDHIEALAIAFYFFFSQLLMQKLLLSSAQFPIQGMESVVASVSGYHGTERFKLIKLISQSGASYVGAMNRSTTHLAATKKFPSPGVDSLPLTRLEKGLVEVCWRFEGKKYDLAKQFNMSIVNHRWVEECIRRGRRVPEQPYLFQSGQEVGPLKLEMPLVTEKASLLLPRQTGAQKDCERPATDIEHGMACHLFGTHSRLLSENEEPSSPSSMLLARHERTSTSSTEPRRKGRRLVKKNIMDFFPSDSEQVRDPLRVCQQQNDVTTPSRPADAMRDKKRLRNRHEGPEDVEEVDDARTFTDSDLHNEDAPAIVDRTFQDPCSYSNGNSNGNAYTARLSASADLSCVICWTDFSSTRGVLPCGHRFCFSCIQSWADLMASRRKISTCPLCKAGFVSITKVDDVASSDQKIYSQTMPYDPSGMDIFILPDGDTPSFGLQVGAHDFVL
ncbi:hypothetical protein RHMOL_Rhmol10G0081300 [Rhododendron molle]|uniref:Uncharacterized protein n=1 Tax=Rhododendron molle TaxID=49168 RepID=A0ACC0M052_RHOML|nr:hypothetical protein RHMOL_Rhmol10G0081300 [Rhododendron molle]